MKTTQSNRIASLVATVTVAFLVIPLAPAAGASSGNLEGLDAKILQLSKPGTTLEEVVALLGEPEKYGWGNKTFAKSNLPERFVAEYPKGLSVMISRGTVWELRAESDGPGFTWQGKLRLGSSLEEVLQAVGQPSRTVVGQALDFASDVLYKDITNNSQPRGYRSIRLLSNRRHELGCPLHRGCVCSGRTGGSRGHP